MVGNEFSWALGRSQAALNAKALGLFSAQGADGKPILYGSKVAFEEDQGVPFSVVGWAVAQATPVAVIERFNKVGLHPADTLMLADPEKLVRIEQHEALEGTGHWEFLRAHRGKDSPPHPRGVRRGGRMSRCIASVSWGKDSLAMLILLIERGWPLDEVVFYDTGMEFEIDMCPTMPARQHKDPPVLLVRATRKPGSAWPWVVRRLMPVECERLQGFPDDWTLITYRGKPAEECPDTPRYKALGNSMAVPVMRWIGERIAMVEEAV